MENRNEENLLLPEELEELWACEDAIRHGLQAWLAVSEALWTIQTKRLYREDYPNFTVYCREKWNLTDRHARNLANAWDVATSLEADPIANPEALPANERQARELRPVPRERRAEVWEQAVANAGGVEHVCAHDVKEARRVLIDDPAEEERRELEAMEAVEQREAAEPEGAVLLVNRDPQAHAMALINKHGVQYCYELMDCMSTIMQEKGL